MLRCVALEGSSLPRIEHLARPAPVDRDHVVGVEAPETEELTLELSAAVKRAVPLAARRALELATADTVNA